MAVVYKDLTKGGIFQNLIKFSIPLILATFLQAVFNITDIIVVGHFNGAIGASGVGIGGQLTYLITNSVMGLSAGVTIVIGQYYGGKKMDKVHKSMETTFTLFLWLSIVLSLVIFFSAGPILRVINTPIEAFDTALSYVRISMVGLVFIFMYNGISAVIRGLGDSKFPLLIIFIAALFNIGIDLLLTGVFKMGGRGVAIGTITSQGLSAFLAVAYLWKKKLILKKHKFKLKMDTVILKTLLKVGMPIALLNATATISFMILTYVVNSLPQVESLYASSAHAIASKYNGFAVLPSRAMASAIAAITAQNTGANKGSRNKKTLFSGIAICMVIGAVLFCITFFFPTQLLRLLGGSRETIIAGKDYMRVMSFDYIILPLGVCAYGTVEGVGKSYVTMWVNVIASLVIRAGAAYLLAKVWKLNMLGVGLSLPIASLFCVIMIWLYIIFNKKHRDILALNLRKQKKQAV